MLVVCKICKVEHDSRDVNNGVCFWCEQKENAESINLQYAQAILWNEGHSNQLVLNVNETTYQR